MSKVAVVTGSNKGIGLEIVKGLLAKLPSPSTVVLCSRDMVRGEAAVKEVSETASSHGNTVVLMQLDITDGSSISNFASRVKNAYEDGLDILVCVRCLWPACWTVFVGERYYATCVSWSSKVNRRSLGHGLVWWHEHALELHVYFYMLVLTLTVHDLKVNNAGFAFKSAAPESTLVQATETLKINFYGTRDLCQGTQLVTDKRAILTCPFDHMYAAILYCNFPDVYQAIVDAHWSESDTLQRSSRVERIVADALTLRFQFCMWLAVWHHKFWMLWQRQSCFQWWRRMDVLLMLEVGRA